MIILNQNFPYSYCTTEIKCRIWMAKTSHKRFQGTFYDLFDYVEDLTILKKCDIIEQINYRWWLQEFREQSESFEQFFGWVLTK